MTPAALESAFDPDEIARLRDLIEQEYEQLLADPAPPGMVPLRIQCRMSSCRHGKHCLDYLRKPVRRGGQSRSAGTVPGSCRDCGVPVLALPLHVGDQPDIASMYELQQAELIRAHYWHVPLDLKAYNTARRLGRAALHQRARAQVAATFSLSVEPFAGRRTSYHGNVIHYAQHATASCCRRCAAYWHGLPEHGEPAPRQVRHLQRLVLAYLDVRLPGLNEDPMTIRDIPPVNAVDLPGPNAVAAADAVVLHALRDGASPVGLLVPAASRLVTRPDARADGTGFVGFTDTAPPPAGGTA